jgi:hypothetical protein
MHGASNFLIKLGLKNLATTLIAKKCSSQILKLLLISYWSRKSFFIGSDKSTFVSQKKFGRSDIVRIINFILFTRACIQLSTSAYF